MPGQWTFTSRSLFFTLGVAIVGCNGGPPAGTVEGKVTWNGKPVANATVQFHSAELGGGAAQTNDNGEFKTDAPLRTGTYHVAVLPYEKVPPAGSKEPVPRPKLRSDIPYKYRTMGKTNVVVTVNAGKNTFNVEMLGK